MQFVGIILLVGSLDVIIIVDVTSKETVGVI